MEEIGGYNKKSVRFQINQFVNNFFVFIFIISFIPPSPFQNFAVLHTAK